MPDPVEPRPEDAFPGVDELLEGLDPPAPNTEQPGDDVRKRLEELMRELERERWVRDSLQEWLRLQEKLRQALERRDSGAVAQLNESMLQGTDHPLGAGGPAYGPNTRDEWIPWVLPESPAPYERSYHLDEELAKALGDSLRFVVGWLIGRILPGGTGQDTVKRIANNLARHAISGLGIQGTIILRSDRLQVWMHLLSDHEGRLKIRRLSGTAYREALRIAQAPPVETFHLAGTIGDLLAYIRSIANLVMDAVRDPAGTLGKAVNGTLAPGDFTPPDVSGRHRLARSLQTGLFDNLERKGLPCKPRITSVAGRTEYSYQCSRDVHFVPVTGPIEGASVPRLPDHLTGNVDFFPVVLLNRVVPPAQMVFIRYQQLYYHAEVSMSHGDDVQKLVDDLLAYLPEATVRAVADEAIKRVGLDKVKKVLGL